MFREASVVEVREVLGRGSWVTVSKQLLDNRRWTVRRYRATWKRPSASV
jgi:hypothetical protein